MNMLFIRNLRAGLDRLEFGFVLVAAGVLIALSVMVCIDVLLRALNTGSNAFTAQFSSYAMLMIAFLPAPWVLRKGQQIDADILSGRMSVRNSLRLQRVMSVIGLLVCLVAAIAAFRYVNELRVNDVTDRLAVNMPRWIPLLTMPIALALLALEFAYSALLPIPSVSSAVDERSQGANAL